MAAPTKPRRAWVYLNEEDESRLMELLKNFKKIDEVTILSELTSAALKSLESKGYRLTLPVHFDIPEDKKTRK